MLAPRLLLALTIIVPIAAWQPTPQCQKAADAYCATSCYNKIKSRPCDGPMIALNDGKDGWKCYSPSTLNANHTKYIHGTCYCSRDSEIRQTLAKCGSPDPSPPLPTPAHVPTPAPAPTIKSVDVFKPGELGYVGMRIPAVLLIADPETTPSPNATILALCECGQPHLPDPATAPSTSYPNSGCDICSKKSTDGGATWSALKVVIKNSSQPAPVYDSVRKQVVMNFNGPPHCVTNGCGFNMQMISTDGGDSWGTPTPLDSFLGDKGHSAAGPGVGLQLTHGPHAGRLLFIGHHGAYVWDSVWFSDDGGKTYSTSATILQGMDEAQLVENSDGLVIANMRHRDAKAKGRAWAVSNSSGADFSPIQYQPKLVSPVCQASIIRSNENQQIYFSNPASSTGRTHGRIKRSVDGITWEEGKEFAITDGGFGYSCLTNLPEKGQLGLLWEVDRKIVFSKVPLDF